MLNDQNQFQDIEPIDDKDFATKMTALVSEPGFERAVRFVLPDVDYAEFSRQLLSIHDKETLQHQVMFPFLEMLAHRTSEGITAEGLDNVSDSKAYTFVTNHRDIVLDASFLNLCFLRAGKRTSEVAIGSNLLIYEWIADLVRLNKSFIVKRGLHVSKALDAARELSSYIHYAVTDKHESVWIAQREGRAKDSHDVTQEAVVKMLALGGKGDFIDNLRELNIEPVAISYEYDPNDYLKTREFLFRRLDPHFKKSAHDDLLSMETGLLKPKGRIHFAVGKCINAEIDTIDRTQSRAVQAKAVCKVIDRAIHSAYRIYPINYVAYDLLHGSATFDDGKHYTPAQADAFKEYISGQLAKIDVPHLSPLDMTYMREMMLTMYANPLRNKIAAIGIGNV